MIIAGIVAATITAAKWVTIGKVMVATGTAAVAVDKLIEEKKKRRQMIMVLADTKKACQRSGYATFRCEDCGYKFDIDDCYLDYEYDENGSKDVDEEDY